MSSQHLQPMSWEAFAAELAAVGSVSADHVTQESRLIGDLGFDSLAISQVAVFMLVDLHVYSFSDSLDRVEWDTVTAGGLYKRYMMGRHPETAATQEIRLGKRRG